MCWESPYASWRHCTTDLLVSLHDLIARAGRRWTAMVLVAKPCLGSLKDKYSPKSKQIPN